MSNSDHHKPLEQQLQNAISDALESERQRLASRLNDDVISQLSLIQSQVSAYQMSADAQSRMAFSVISTLVQQALQQAYNLENNLNPTTLQTLGFIAAVEAYTNQQKRTSGVGFTLNFQHIRDRLPLQIELALFRYLQDAIDMAIAQRGCSHLILSFAVNDLTYTLTISENGRLIDPPQFLSLDRLQSLGADITYDTGQYGGLETIIQLETIESVDFTDREQQVLRLLARGLTNKEIAYQLNIKPRTIKFHLDNIYSKLNVSTRTEAAIYALQHGLTD